MSKQVYITFLILLLNFQFVFSQESILEKKQWSIKVKIIDKATNLPIKNADVQVNGRYFSFQFANESYLIKAVIGNELLVSHPDFETVYYTIKSSDAIKIMVEGFERNRSSRLKSSKKEKSSRAYFEQLDSAKFYKKRNISKSVTFIEKALQNNQNRKRNAAAYKVLADIYLFWKQYDLAINNYQTSLKYSDDVATEIQLAKANFLFKDYVSSEIIYTKALNKKQSSYEKILILEGLGDVFFKTKKYVKSRSNYTKALKIAKSTSVVFEITDLNSKIAEVFAAEGNTVKANVYYNNSLKLASKENAQRGLKEKEKVANFYNRSRRFDDEIKLRKESLKETDFIVSKSKGIQEDSITAQKISYKIGSAYVLKEAYKEAIPFLKKSIDVADKKQDLVIQKDATRKLSEVYATVGEYTKALKSYQEYVSLVDRLYIKKEQEIGQVKRFNKKISENQNRISSLEKDKDLTETKINLAYKDKQLSEESNKRQQYVIYTLIAGISLLVLLAYLMFRNSKQQKLANNLLALKSMRSQMNPHFIFNALNSVNSFIAVNDERNANRYLTEFSILMRSVLENSDEDFISMTKEIELLELYVKLEHNRFKDKFDYTISVDESISLEEFSIPPMLLQPYIENAIWHGLRYKKEKGSLEIIVQQKDTNTLSIVIVDNGIGRKRSAELKTENQLKQKSKGMSTIKSRIAILNDMYQDRVSVSIADASENGEGTKVLLLLKRE